MKALEKGIVTNTTTKRIQELERKIEEIEKNILIEQSKINIAIPRESVEKYLITSLSLVPRLLVNTLIKKIIMTNDKIEIYYNYTKNEGPDNSSDLSFYKGNFVLKQNNTCSNKLIERFIEIEMFV